jgi:hypothetical protein
MANEKIAIIVSGISIIIAIINTLYTRYRINKLSEFHNQNFDYTQNKDNDDFMLHFKNDMHELSLSMLELYTTKNEINLLNKGDLLYVLESKYNKALVVKYLNIDIYNEFMALKIFTDESLDLVIYKKDFNSISSSIRKIKYFLDSVNIYVNNNMH